MFRKDLYIQTFVQFCQLREQRNLSGILLVVPRNTTTTEKKLIELIVTSTLNNSE